jgi:hypothetical protein
VKLVDFGLAARIQGSLRTLSVVVRPVKAAGTPAYMAPEQWEGRILTRGADQWALAVLIYELVAGCRPFDGPTDSAMMMLVREANPEAPKPLSKKQWAALKRSFLVDRRERYASCAALVQALAKAHRGTSKLVEVSEVRMPEEFAGLETLQEHHGSAAWKMGLAAAVTLAALAGAGYYFCTAATRESKTARVAAVIAKTPEKAEPPKAPPALTENLNLARVDAPRVELEKSKDGAPAPQNADEALAEHRGIDAEAAALKENENDSEARTDLQTTPDALAEENHRATVRDAENLSADALELKAQLATPPTPPPAAERGTSVLPVASAPKPDATDHGQDARATTDMRPVAVVAHSLIRAKTRQRAPVRPLSAKDLRDNGQLIELDGRNSFPQGPNAQYQWAQVGGRDLSLPLPSFAKPYVCISIYEPGEYRFALTVTDRGVISKPAQVRVIVEGEPDPVTANLGGSKNP